MLTSSWLSVLKNPKTAALTIGLRAYGLAKIPLLAYVRPTVIEDSPIRTVLMLPLARRNQNQLGSMFLGALTTGADVTVGFVVIRAMQARRANVSMVFKSMKVDFLKRAEGDVHFACDDVTLIRDLVDKAIETGERVELELTVIATVPQKTGDEPVARFTMTLSLKHRPKGGGRRSKQ